MQNQKQRQDAKFQLRYIYDKPNNQFDTSTQKICPQISIFNSLMKYEQRIDQIIKVKRGELQENFIQPSQFLKRTLRIIIYSEYQNDDWKLQIKGQTLGDDKKPLTNFFKQIEVQLDKSFYPSQNVITWNKSPNSQESSGLEIKRKGPQSDVIVTLQPYSFPQKYKLNKSLQQILGIKEGTRSQILYCFWEYVKLNNLIDKENKDQIIADEPLKQLLQQERIQFSNLNMHLKYFLTNLDPIVIKHNLSNGNIQGMDIIVDYELQYQPELMPFLAQKVVTEDSAEKNKKPEHPFIQLNTKIKGLEKQIQRYIEQTKSHKQKREIYLAYRKSPSIFLENLFHQQNSYLEMMQNDDEIKNDDPKNMKFLLKNQEIVERQIRKHVEGQQ
ncbi:hypothetical protein pb186bvf_000015 [Paramecium bursaria]